MSAIGPGDFVECVDAGPSEKTGAPCPLVLGSVYQVERIVHSAHPMDRRNPLGVVVCGIEMPQWALGFPMRRFKPIYRPSESLFLERLMDVPAPAEPERVTA